jgi:hypothetical protein
MSEPPEQETRWWRNPQGIVSAATIFTLVVGFFWVREKSMWEMSARIAALELRGSNSIAAAGTRLERTETMISTLRDQINFLERKIDRLELVLAEVEESRKQKSYENPIK